MLVAHVAEALRGDDHRIVTQPSVYGIHGTHKAVVALNIRFAEEVGLNAILRNYRGGYNARFLVSAAAGKDLPESRTRRLDHLDRAVGRRLECRNAAVAAIRCPILLETVRPREYGHLVAGRMLAAQLLGRHRGELGHLLGQSIELVYLGSETARGAYRLLGLKAILETYACLSAQLAPCPHTRNAHLRTHPFGREGSEVVRRLYTQLDKPFRESAADAPYILDGKPPQHLLHILRTVHVTSAAQLGITLAELRGYLGKCLCRGNADRYRYARITQTAA